MGRVLRAVRLEHGIEREVAIKFVRRDVLGPATRARFLREHRALATLDHPGIARLLDAGEADDGTPYVAMELVRGEPLLDYCAARSLGLVARLGLFRQVLAAVSHAHRHLIVHRDIKPANVLVDARGHVKLLDFGLAKALDVDVGETATVERFLTPAYAAPEQLRGDPAGIGCDIYALGALLYELLSGSAPFRLEGRTAAEIERLVLVTPPASLERGDGTSDTARARRLGIAKWHAWRRQLRGDLDGIVLRCLRKAPHERYLSADELDADLANYLEGRPVKARGGHGWYRFRKFVTRNAGAVSAVALVAAALLAGLAAFASQARIAERRAAELEQVVAFQAEMIGRVEPHEAGVLLGDYVQDELDDALALTDPGDRDRIARIESFAAAWGLINATDAARHLVERTILDPAAESLSARFVDEPLVHAALAEALAERYAALGRYDAALPLQQRALAQRRSALGADHPDTLVSMRKSAGIHLERGALTEAESLYREVLDRRRRALGEEHRDTVASIGDMGAIAWNAALAPGIPGAARDRRIAEAERYHREALAKATALFGNDDPATLTSLRAIAAINLTRGDLDEAERYARKALEGRRRTLGDDHRETLDAIDLMFSISYVQRRHDDAERYARESWERTRAKLGEDHPRTFVALYNIGLALRMQGKLAEAMAYHEQALELARRTQGDEHLSTLGMLVNLGELATLLGRHDLAEESLSEALEKYRRAWGDAHPHTLRAVQAMVRVRLDQGRGAEALELIGSTEATARQALAADPRALARFLSSLAQARLAQRDFVEASKDELEAHDLLRAAPTATPAEVTESARRIAELFAELHAADPRAGHDVMASTWRGNAESLAAAAAV
ncbi:MAG TPA: serine/threonine-protein kinase, partial [Xanthomonadales bacterium]|nr:serine/threonine-protein kinase [Xanthomonadales bacterium]